MAYHDGLVALVVERTHLLPSRRVRGLVIVAVKAVPHDTAFLSEPKLVVDSLRLLASLSLGVEVLQSLHELGAVSVLLIRGECRLDSLVGDDVAVGEVLGDDACAGLLLLLDVVVAIHGLRCLGYLIASDLVDGLGGADLDRVGAELGVVEEEGRFRSGHLLEGDGGGLRIIAGRLYTDRLNLAAEAEERLDLYSLWSATSHVLYYGAHHLRWSSC